MRGKHTQVESPHFPLRVLEILESGDSRACVAWRLSWYRESTGVLKSPDGPTETLSRQDRVGPVETIRARTRATNHGYMHGRQART